MSKLFKCIGLTAFLSFMSNAYSQQLSASDNVSIQNECREKTEKNMVVLLAAGYSSIKSEVIFEKCVKHTKVILEFKRLNSSKDLQELYSQTISQLKSRIIQLHDLISVTYNENESNELIRQADCFNKQLYMINLSKDENLLVSKKNIGIFQYHEGSFFKNTLFYADNSLRNNCSKNRL